ncbi:MAG: gfo/Idh/MocA family oxidoreductase [Planctomycetota bacterium]|nr:MAG: gfo/Idh/MocA family oxidoreductase [Planctomycetota bacterium]
MNSNSRLPHEPSRRQFLAGSAAGAAALHLPKSVFRSSTETLKIGLIGCGGRGSGAAQNCVAAAPGMELHAMGDVFADHLNGSKARLAKGLGEAFKVTEETSFVGFDAYQKVLACDVDLVILATPPGFRPVHLRAAVEAGKHVFMEKPVAVDPSGIRSVIESGEMAKQKGLGIVAGTQRRHDPVYIETMRRIHDGAIGELVAAQCYWNQGGLWMKQRKPEWSDMEWQLRNWLYFTWLSGDHIVEQHIHNIDVLNWAFQGHPVKAMGMGGRQVRTDPAYGHIFDHFAVEFEYENGARVLSMCRQIDNCANRVSERVVGTGGSSNCNGRILGDSWWRFRGQKVNPYQQEHTDLIESIRAGTPLNEAKQVAESTMTAILGRMSAYSGKEITWQRGMESTMNLVPESLQFGDVTVADIALPGTSPLE